MEPLAVPWKAIVRRVCVCHREGVAGDQQVNFDQATTPSVTAERRPQRCVAVTEVQERKGSRRVDP